MDYGGDFVVGSVPGSRESRGWEEHVPAACAGQGIRETPLGLFFRLAIVAIVAVVALVALVAY